MGPYGSDGTTVLVAGKVGEAFCSGAVDHSAHYVGTTGPHALLIELKSRVPEPSAGLEKQQMHRPQLLIQTPGPSDFAVKTRSINTRHTYGKVVHQLEVHIKCVRLYADSDSEMHFEDVKVAFAKGTITFGSNPGGLAASSANLGFFLRHLLQRHFC